MFNFHCIITNIIDAVILLWTFLWSWACMWCFQSVDFHCRLVCPTLICMICAGGDFGTGFSTFSIVFNTFNTEYSILLIFKHFSQFTSNFCKDIIVGVFTLQMLYVICIICVLEFCIVFNSWILANNTISHSEGLFWAHSRYVVEIFWENSLQLLVVDCFCKGALSWMFIRVLNIPVHFIYF